MKHTRFLLLLAISLAIPGCGGGADPNAKPVFPIEGTVTLFGTPLAEATIAFAPTTSGQPTAIGTTDASGKFVLTTYNYGDGAAEGSFKVVISKSIAAQAETTTSDDDDHGSDSSGVAGSHAAAAATPSTAVGMVPPNYGSSSTTPLTADVKASGENVFDFEIK